MVERIRTLLEARQLTPTQFADVIGVARPIVSHILSGRNKPSLEVVQRILAAMPDLAMPWLLNGTGPMLAEASVAAVTSVLSGATAAAVSPAAPEPAPIVADERAQAVVQAAVEATQVSALSSERADKQYASAAMPIASALGASNPAPVRNRIAAKRFVANAVPLGSSPQEPDIAQVPPQPLAATTELTSAAAPVQNVATGLPASTSTPLAAAPLQPVAADETPGMDLASALFAGGDKPIRRIVIFYRDGSFADYQPE